MALFHGEWTALAQSELFYRIVLVNERKTELLLKLMREKEVFADYAKSAKSITFGAINYRRDGIWLKHSIDEIASYCPEIVELSYCNLDDVPLQHLQAMRKLDKLNLFGGSLLGTSPFTARPYGLPLITRLSISQTQGDTLALDPNSLHSLRSVRSLPLHLSSDAWVHPYLPLLPQITSLTLPYQLSPQDMNTRLAASTALASLSLTLTNVALLFLDDEILLMIKQRITILELSHSHREDFGGEELIEIIEGSEVMKKLVLDGLCVTASVVANRRVTQLVRELKPVCNEKGIELWRINFRRNNGNVNLDSN